MIRHLSESEFTDALCGLASPAVHAHLAACDACSAELATVTGAVKSFNQSSLSESRRLAELHPIDSAILGALAAPARNRRFWQAPWALNGAVGLVTASLIFAVMLTLHRSSPITTASVSAPAPSTTTDAADDLDHDNQMLAAIDAELSQPDLSPLESIPGFGPPPSAQPHHKKA